MTNPNPTSDFTSLAKTALTRLDGMLFNEDQPARIRAIRIALETVQSDRRLKFNPDDLIHRERLTGLELHAWDALAVLLPNIEEPNQLLAIARLVINAAELHHRPGEVDITDPLFDPERLEARSAILERSRVIVANGLSKLLSHVDYTIRLTAVKYILRADLLDRRRNQPDAAPVSERTPTTATEPYIIGKRLIDTIFNDPALVDEIKTNIINEITPTLQLLYPATIGANLDDLIYDPDSGKDVRTTTITVNYLPVELRQQLDSELYRRKHNRTRHEISARCNLPLADILEKADLIYLCHLYLPQHPIYSNTERYPAVPIPEEIHDPDYNPYHDDYLEAVY